LPKKHEIEEKMIAECNMSSESDDSFEFEEEESMFALAALEIVKDINFMNWLRRKKRENEELNEEFDSLLSSLGDVDIQLFESFYNLA
jgi:hypothetical protein